MSEEKGIIRHPGIVEEVGEDLIEVKILSMSACASCHAKGSCSVADVEEKVVEVPNDHQKEYSKGDNVMLRMESSLGMKALFYGYLLPFIVLLATLIIMISVTSREGLSALVAILVLAPYYLGLYYFRDRMKKIFTFRIE